MVVKYREEQKWLQKSIVRAEKDCLKHETVPSCCHWGNATQLFSSLKSYTEVLFGRVHKRAYTNIAVSRLTCIKVMHKAMRRLQIQRKKKSQSNGKKPLLKEEFNSFKRSLKKINIWHMTAVIRSVKKHHFFCKLRFNQLVQCTSSLRIQQWLHCKMLTLSHCFHTFEPMP